MSTTSSDILKIVYYGPGLSGKTANLQALALAFNLPDPLVLRLDDDSQVAGADFELLELPARLIAGQDRPLQLLTVPGQLTCAHARETLLDGARGIVFVADSRAERLDANLILLDELGLFLSDQFEARSRPPVVLQFNRRDSRRAMDLQQLHDALIPYADLGVPACALQGSGVTDTLSALLPLLRRDRAHRSH